MQLEESGYLLMNCRLGASSCAFMAVDGGHLEPLLASDLMAHGSGERLPSGAGEMAMDHPETAPLRVLVVADRTFVAELQRALPGMGMTPEVKLATGEQDFATLLASMPDIILVANGAQVSFMPRILSYLNEHQLDHPLFMMTGATSAGTVDDARHGFAAHLLVDKIEQLGTVVDCALSHKRQRHAHRREEETRARLASIVETATDAIIAETRDGLITIWNRAAEQLFGYTAREIIGRYSNMLLPTDQQGELPSLLRQLDQGEQVAPFETTLARKDGTLVDVSVSVSAIRDRHGNVAEVTSIIRDVSWLRAVDRARDEFLSSMAHDLKNPLTAVGGIAQYVQRKLQLEDVSDSERLVTSLGKVVSAAQRMATLINQMLDATQIQMGQNLELDLQLVDVVALLRQSVDDQQSVATKHHYVFEAPDSSLTVTCDGPRIETVVSNLLTNAAKYSPQGGVITVQVGREEDAGSGWAVFSVSDQGLGVPEADLPHIFERFRRGTNVSGRIEGTGIGLASVRHIVEQHGGSVAVQSNEGVGTTFTVRLPIRPANYVGHSFSKLAGLF